jgi:LAGLIDADG endonuclease
MKIDHIELAWAAGFFDGEGTIYFNPQQNKGSGYFYKSINLSVSQHMDNPYVIERFNSAISGIGKVSTNPNGKGRQTRCRVTNFHHVQFIVALLWKYLCPVKRKQAKDSLLGYLSHASKQNPRDYKGDWNNQYSTSKERNKCDLDFPFTKDEIDSYER